MIKKLNFRDMSERGKVLMLFKMVDYMLENDCGCRAAANQFGYSKSALWDAINDNLEKLDPNRYAKIRKLLDNHKEKKERKPYESHRPQKEAMCNNYPPREELIRKLNEVGKDEVCREYLISESVLNIWRVKLDIYCKRVTKYY